MDKLIKSAFHVSTPENRSRNCFSPRTREECIFDFASRVEIRESGCWEWTGSKQGFGHGILKFMGTNVKAHRLAMMLHKKLDQINGFVCHDCDNPACVNPGHLYIGNAGTNADDRDSRNRRMAPKGEGNPRAKLSERQVDEIRSKYKPFIYTTKMLSREYGVCETQIKNITGGRQWA